jgi:hypothetical protein
LIVAPGRLAMRFFDLLDFQDVMLFVFPTLVFILLFAVALAHIHFRTRESEEREQRLIHVFPGDIGERDGPVPLVLILIIIGFVLWALAYTLGRALVGGPF